MDDIEMLSGIQEAISQILDLVDAHRAACLERGYSPTASEMMALQFHEMLVSGIGKSKLQGGT